MFSHIGRLLCIHGSASGRPGAPRWVRFTLSLGLLAFACEARATTVGCNGAPSGTYDFPTLTAAVSGAPLSSNTITVYGTCTEDVVISGAQNLTIAGAPGAVLMDAGMINVVAGGILEIDNSQNVTIQNLKFQLTSYPVYGPSPAILVNGSSLLMEGIDIEGASGTDGMDINPNSSVQLIGANTIENNNDGQADGEGISLTGPAANLMIGSGPGAPVGCTVIQGNGDDGVLASAQASVGIIGFPNRCITIQNNGAFGVQISGSSTGVLSNRGPSTNITLSGNAAGIYASLYGHIQLAGPMLIQNNSVSGIKLRDASANVLPLAAQEGPVIEQNGGSTNSECCLAPQAGISVQGNSNLLLQAGTIANNLVPGVAVQDDSSAIINGSAPISITQNPIGVSVANASTVSLDVAPSISGNADGDVVCGAYSVAYGDASKVGRMRCNVFSPQPSGPGNGHHGNPWR